MWSGDEVSLLLSEVETVEITHPVKKPTTTSIDGDEATLKKMQIAQSELPKQSPKKPKMTMPFNNNQPRLLRKGARQKLWIRKAGKLNKI